MVCFRSVNAATQEAWHTLASALITASVVMRYLSAG